MIGATLYNLRRSFVVDCHRCRPESDARDLAVGEVGVGTVSCHTVKVRVLIAVTCEGSGGRFRC